MNCSSVNKKTSLCDNQLYDERQIIPGKKYRHYSGKIYTALNIARNSENPQDLFVIYQADYECPTFGIKQVWARPYAMFASTVEIDGIVVYRFTEL